VDAEADVAKRDETPRKELHRREPVGRARARRTLKGSEARERMNPLRKERGTVDEGKTVAKPEMAETAGAGNQ
jgi:hypothetical protein